MNGQDPDSDLEPTTLQPRHWAWPPSDVLLADGAIAVIRSLDPGDRAQLLALHEGVSQDTLRLRFFSLSPAAGRAYVARLFDPSNRESVALVAVLRGRISALATAELLSPERAEVAFLVSDQERGRGLGSLLLEHLAALCREHGVTRFEAEVLADNYGMLGVFRAAGFAAVRRADGGEVSVELRTEASPAAVDAADRREWRSEARSLRPLLYPESVAVVGVRRTAVGQGNSVLDSIRAGGFAGRLYAVHPEAESVAGLPAHRRLDAIGEKVDLVVVVVPADQVLAVIADAAAAGVGAAIVVSSGFTGPEGLGVAAERELLRTARSHSVRVVGPDSQGVLSQGAERHLNATFARALPGPGGLAIASQSGGVGFTLLDLARDAGVGVHSFVSLGAKLDVSSNDLLAAWMDDPQVTAAALHLESFGNALKFARTARRFAERKPLLCVLGGRSTGSAVGVDALFAQAGVIPCRSASEVADTAALLLGQPIPAGYRIGVVSNAGGMGMLVADLADAEGLSVPELSSQDQATVQEAVPGAVRARNPVDVGADLSPSSLEAGVRALLSLPELDAVVVVLVPTSLADPAGLFAALSRACAQSERPVLLVASDASEHAQPDGVVVYRTAEAAVGALARTMRYAAWRRVPIEDPPSTLHVRASNTRAWATRRLDARDGRAEWLPASASAQLLRSYGIEPVGVLADSAEEATRAAAAIGYPVVVKVADPSIRHKTDRGLVRTGLLTPAQVTDAMDVFRDNLGGASVEVYVQPVMPGVEVACGVVRDAVFGPLVRIAAGGVATEIWKDEVYLVPPVTRGDVGRALRGLRMWPLLDGYRGTAPVDVDGLVSVLVGVGQLVVDVPQVSDLDLNPILVAPAGVHCVDAKVRLQPSDALDAGIPRRLRSPS
jgi:acyl-CoA synthetase (NDP forming)/GNAT superfamily N-acetyltransferase